MKHLLQKQVWLNSLSVGGFQNGIESAAWAHDLLQQLI
jgi:hypothetical protein